MKILRVLMAFLLAIYFDMPVMGQLYINSSQSIASSSDLVTVTGSSETSMMSAGRPLQIVGGLVGVLDISTITTVGAGSIDFFLTTSDGISEWDVIHFPTIDTTNYGTYMAKVSTTILPQIVTGTTPVNEGIIRTDGMNGGPLTIAADSIRHGPVGTNFKVYVVSSDMAQSVTYRLTLQIQ
jgi:hypothetical protein